MRLRDVGIDRMMVRKNIGQSSLLFSFLAVALFAFGWVRVWVVKLLDMGQFQTIIEQFRDYEKFAPVSFDALFTYTGRVGMTFDEPIVILCTVIWCVARGSDVVSGELGRGTLEMLLSQPISRTRFLLSHAVVSTAGLMALCLLLWGGMTVGIETTTLTETVPPPSIRVPFLGFELPLTNDEPTQISFPMSERVAPETYTSAVFQLFVFGFFLLGMSSCFSSFDRYRWRTIGAVMTVYVIQLVMFGLGKAAESLAWLQSWSFFNCYKPQKMTTLVRDGDLWSPWSFSTPVGEGMFPPMFYPGLLLVIGSVFYIIAVVRFQQRDLPAPL
ncbi:ABC transporter permease subunit [Aporhodopirellula aestuarii]|uniref:ABC transporter permease subunit n=1 Tax=Aporhodopirellula aestuarii TaxID=2950107 RepID=UPI002AFEF34D|nr:ABC transporter permease subunit [Aporhodopirellula aestuarii]